MDITIIIIVSTVLLIGFITYFMKSKMKKDAWQGELVDKREETSRSGDDDTTNYALHIKLLDGTSKRLYVSKKLYNQFSVGDNLEKVLGEVNPKKQG